MPLGRHAKHAPDQLRLARKPLLQQDKVKGALRQLPTMNSGVPRTLWQLDFRCIVASPRSPILITPEVPFTNMLSHFKSRCTIAGSWPCRYTKPWTICHAQRLSTG